MAYVVTVTFRIVPGQMQAFLPLMRNNALASVRDEPGCLQFDVCTDGDQPDTVFLYEIYTDRAAFDAHLKTPHFKALDAATPQMVVGKTLVTFDQVDRNPA
ncbi:putative quinol monooxygenase [uncultured Tateyamaria sp.]|uniref:putative quinol monooxygenase n=1 Tax=Tateyamaria sp. 1078 TaxID=3417464 RepID=UPI00261EAC39|nr:putative quinol monooxygenase [uncultured Tateyamaria sp.]